MKLAAEQSQSARIAAIIRQEIQGGRLRPGEKLEAARTLAGHLDVGRQVIRSAIRILERESLVRTAPGSGVFVRDYLPTSAGRRRIRIGFVNWHDSLAENFPLRAYLELGCNIRKTAAALGIHRNSALARIERIREIAGGDGVFSYDGYFSLIILEAARN